MPHVVTERCVDCRYTDCCAVCPSDSFFLIEKPAMLVIDPSVCIDCGLCVPECPVYAIYPSEEVPLEYREWIKKNEELVPQGKPIKTKMDALPSAVPLAKIQEREKARGWKISEPALVAGVAGPSAAGASGGAGAAGPAKSQGGGVGPAETSGAGSGSAKAGKAPAASEGMPAAKSSTGGSAGGVAPKAGDAGPSAAGAAVAAVTAGATGATGGAGAAAAGAAKSQGGGVGPAETSGGGSGSAKAGKAPAASGGGETSAAAKKTPAAGGATPLAGGAAPAASGGAAVPGPGKPAPVAAIAAPAAVAAGSRPFTASPPGVQSRPPLPVRPGGRIRLGFRTGTVKEIRKGPGNFYTDMRILFDGEEKPVWYVYSALQTWKERGDLEILDAGPAKGFLTRLLRR